MKRGWKYFGSFLCGLTLYGCAAGKSYITPMPEPTREIRAYKTEQTTVKKHKGEPEFFKTTSYYDQGPISQIIACSPGKQLDEENVLHFLAKRPDGSGISMYVKKKSACERCHSNGNKF